MVVTGTQAFTASQDTKIRQWDVEAAKEVRQYCGHSKAILTVQAMAGNMLLSAGKDKVIRVVPPYL
jgi:WD40 repeat protein